MKKSFKPCNRPGQWKYFLKVISLYSQICSFSNAKTIGYLDTDGCGLMLSKT